VPLSSVFVCDAQGQADWHPAGPLDCCAIVFTRSGPPALRLLRRGRFTGRRSGSPPESWRAQSSSSVPAHCPAGRAARANVKTRLARAERDGAVARPIEEKRLLGKAAKKACWKSVGVLGRERGGGSLTPRVGRSLLAPDDQLQPTRRSVTIRRNSFCLRFNRRRPSCLQGGDG
jgi:hypothetical protein